MYPCTLFKKIKLNSLKNPFPNWNPITKITYFELDIIVSKLVCIPSDTGYSLKVYRFASAPFIDSNQLLLFHNSSNFFFSGEDRSLNIFVKEEDKLTFHRHPVAQSTDCIRSKVRISSIYMKENVMNCATKRLMLDVLQL